MKVLHIPARVTLTLAVALALTTPAAVFSAEQILDRTAAQVNNDIVLESELNAEERRQLHAHPGLTNIQARKAALEVLIAASLILQAAQAQGADLTDTQVDQALEQLALRNRTTASHLLEQLAPGKSEAEQRESFKRGYLISEFRNSRVRSRLYASDAEVDALAANLKNLGSVEPRYRLAQVVVPLASNPTEGEYNQAQAASRKVVAELKAGADPALLAAQYGRGSLASQSGDLGYMPESQVPLPFVPALVRSKPGDVVGPFRSPLGMHILKVLDITHEAVTPVRTYAASHSLIRPTLIVADAAARERIREIRSDIIAGRITFAAAARKYSEDTPSAGKGGDLGYAVPDRYDPAFAQAMVALKPGQMSPPIKSSFGWHLIYLRDIKIDQNSDTALRDRARALILDRKFREESALFEQELRDSAYIRILDTQLLASGMPATPAGQNQVSVNRAQEQEDDGPPTIDVSSASAP